jgi:hypothetical protein
MALGDGMVGSDGNTNGDDSSEVPLPAKELVEELDTLNDTFPNKDKLLRHAGWERNDYKARLKSALMDLEFAKAPIMSDEVECDSCAIHKSNLATLETKYAYLIGEPNEVKSRPSLLGACKFYLAL